MRPEIAFMELGSVQLDWTKHAMEQAARKQIKLTNSLLIPAGSIVEIEREQNRTTKLVVRTKYNASYDRVSVLVPMSEGLFRVVTTWLNHVRDTHNTLNKERLQNVG
jgi:hypothetical protein